jgi:hypothetical protein
MPKLTFLRRRGSSLVPLLVSEADYQEDDESISRSQRLALIIQNARRNREQFVVFPEEMVDEACINELAAFRELKMFVLARGTFPVEQITRLNLSELVVKELILFALIVRYHKALTEN